MPAPRRLPALCQTPASLDSLHTFKNPLASLPLYPKITNQIKKVEPQAFFFSIEDKMIVARPPRLSARDGGQAVIGEKVGR